MFFRASRGRPAATCGASGRASSCATSPIRAHPWWSLGTAQIVVALLLTIPKVWRGDRARLALGQQNGLTAIILALLLEPNFPGTIAVVAPAIIVVNLLHALCNGLYDRIAPPVRDPDDDQRPPALDDRHTARFTRGLRFSNAVTSRFRRPA